MSNVIEVKGLGKKYRIGKAEKKSDTLFGSIVNGLKQPLENLRKIRSLTRLDDEEDVIWALRDISFEVKQGEVLGIIGHNGAGKSTLLKILSRITEPTVGEVLIKGRVAALLEVGTGFHPELTGRENVYMNGTILGMLKKEIDHKLDEIVDFSGVEKFLDTPVKFYSSGMRVRLGFSVAAHLEPEILIIDEVLSVGDAEFQKKCLGKMEDVTENQGRTVLFVSHNMASVQALCSKGILLKNGEVEIAGDISTAVTAYLGDYFQLSTYQTWDLKEAPGNEIIRIKSIKVSPKHKEPSDPIYVHDDFEIEIVFFNFNDTSNIDITLSFFSERDILLFVSGSNTDSNWHGKKFPTGLFTSAVAVPGHLLNAGKYRVEILFGHAGRIAICKLDELISFEVLHSAVGRSENMAKAPGLFRPIFKWTTNYLDKEI